MKTKLILLVALLFLTGTCLAETKVKTSSIADEAVTNAKLGGNAVTTDKVALDTLTAADLAPDSVGTSEIADGTVAAGDLTATLDLSGKTLTLPAANRSKVVQSVNTSSGALISTGTTIPLDDTIPQNTEGAELMTLAVTPTNATHKLKIEVVVQVGGSAAGNMTIALFQDSAADAIAVGSGRIDASGAQVTVSLIHYMTAGTTSATTFKVRGGPSAGNLIFNGSGAVRRFGGASSSSITITEIIP